MLLLAWLVSFARAEDAWIVSNVELLRWPDKAHVTVSLEKGEKVEIMVRDAKIARVRRGTDFGWVDLGLLSATAVEAPPSDVPLSLEGLPADFKLPPLPGAAP